MNNYLLMARQYFANTVFTHKVQEAAAERNERQAVNIKRINIGVVFFVLVFIVFQLIFNNNIFLYISISFSIFEIIYLFFQLSFDCEKNMVLHKNSALKYMQLRDDYGLLIVDIMNNADLEEIKRKLNNLKHDYQIISELSPQTNDDDYLVAQKRLNLEIKTNEHFTWSDKEIDRFLPEKLRIFDK